MGEFTQECVSNSYILRDAVNRITYVNYRVTLFCYFNSTTVRLGARSGVDGRYLNTYFNSSMVRLGAVGKIKKKIDFIGL